VVDRKAVVRRELDWHEHEAGRRIPLDQFLYDPPAFDRTRQSGLSFLFRILPGGEPVFRRVHAWLQRVDQRLLARFPACRRLAWYGLSKLRAGAQVARS